jgi:hypothetical protein
MAQGNDWLIAALELGWSAHSPAGSGRNGPMEKLAGFQPIRCCQTSSACDHGTIFNSRSQRAVMPNSDGRELTRRSILVGAAASLICRPAIVRAASLMPIRQLIVSTVPINPEKPWLGFIGTWRIHFMRQALRRGWEGRDSQTFGGTSEAAARRYVTWMTAQGL